MLVVHGCLSLNYPERKRQSQVFGAGAGASYPRSRRRGRIGPRSFRSKTPRTGGTGPGREVTLHALYLLPRFLAADFFFEAVFFLEAVFFAAVFLEAAFLPAGLRGVSMAAWAAAKRAIGTRNGLQLT